MDTLSGTVISPNAVCRDSFFYRDRQSSRKTSLFLRSGQILFRMPVSASVHFRTVLFLRLFSLRHHRLYYDFPFCLRQFQTMTVSASSESDGNSDVLQIRMLSQSQYHLFPVYLLSQISCSLIILYPHGFQHS